MPPAASVRFTASDGFATSLPARAAAGRGDDNGARAYLAVEPADAPWPPLKAGDPASAGPFYLVWMRPERGRIVPEQWPYRIARDRSSAAARRALPGDRPRGRCSPPTAPVNRGFAIFTKNCIVCHTLNLGGDATIGPDLNVPFNPTEYLRADALRRLIRDPQSLRRWPSARMPAFDAGDAERSGVERRARLPAATWRNRKVPVPAGGTLDPGTLPEASARQNFSSARR